MTHQRRAEVAYSIHRQAREDMDMVLHLADRPDRRGDLAAHAAAAREDLEDVVELLRHLEEPACPRCGGTVSVFTNPVIQEHYTCLDCVIGFDSNGDVVTDPFEREAK